VGMVTHAMVEESKDSKPGDRAVRSRSFFSVAVRGKAPWVFLPIGPLTQDLPQRSPSHMVEGGGVRAARAFFSSSAILGVLWVPTSLGSPMTSRMWSLAAPR